MSVLTVIANPLSRKFLLIGLIAALAVMSAHWLWHQGRKAQIVDQLVVDKEMRSKIVEEINNETIDLSDPSAVDERLRELAGKRNSTD